MRLLVPVPSRCRWHRELRGVERPESGLLGPGPLELGPLEFGPLGLGPLGLGPLELGLLGLGPLELGLLGLRLLGLGLLGLGLLELGLLEPLLPVLQPRVRQGPLASQLAQLVPSPERASSRQEHPP